MTTQEFDNAKKNDPYLRPRKDPSEAEIRLFLNEVDFHCPLCGKILQSRQQKKQDEKKFQIAHIYPHSPTKTQYETLLGLERLGIDSESFENKIALCRDCHATQDFHTTAKEYLDLVQIKKSVLENSILQNITQSMSIENEIITVIQKTQAITEEELSELNYTPVNLAKKFNQNELRLKSKVLGYITTYFPFIRETFISIDGLNDFNFEVLCQQIKSCFIKLSNKTNDKSLIFNNMVEWIMHKTQSQSLEACEAVIAYFIQQCEVFNEITE